MAGGPSAGAIEGSDESSDMEDVYTVEHLVSMRIVVRRGASPDHCIWHTVAPCPITRADARLLDSSLAPPLPPRAVQMRGKRRLTQFRVRWEGYSAKDDTWEDEDRILDVTAATHPCCPRSPGAPALAFRGSCGSPIRNTNRAATFMRALAPCVTPYPADPRSGQTRSSCRHTVRSGSQRSGTSSESR